MPSKVGASEQNITEILLSAVIIILAVMAIGIFLVSGATVWFYGLFVMTAGVMLYTWYRLSRVSPSNAATPVAVQEVGSQPQQAVQGQQVPRRRRGRPRKTAQE